MREDLTRERLLLLMNELSQTAPRRGSYNVYFVGGGTAEFIRSGLVDVQTFRSLVAAIPDSAYAKHPNLSRLGVEKAVESFLADRL